MTSRGGLRWGAAAVFITILGCESHGIELVRPIFGPAYQATQSASRHAPASPPLEPLPVGARPSEAAEAKPAPIGYVAMTAIARRGDYGNAILLVHPSDDVVVPIYVGGTEALSIRLRLENKTYARPLTHDLLDTLVKSMGAAMLRAQVNALENGIFVGSVVFDNEGEIIELDARPSDAIALAIGNQVPIYVAAQVIAKAGVRTDDSQPAPKPKTPPVAL